MKLKNLYVFTSQYLLLLSVFFITNLAYSETAPPSSNPDDSKWAAYAENIKNCTPGTFQLPDRVQAAVLQMVQKMGATVPPPSSIPPITYQIIGWQSDKCQVNITQTEASSDASSPASVHSLNCAIPQDRLGVIANRAAQIASGDVALSTEDPAGKAMKDSCTEGNL